MDSDCGPDSGKTTNSDRLRIGLRLRLRILGGVKGFWSQTFEEIEPVAEILGFSQQRR